MANWITTLKMVHIKQIFKAKKKEREIERAGGGWWVASEVALLSPRKNWNPGLQDLVKSRQASWSFIFALPCASASFSFLVCQSPQHRRKWPQIWIYMSQDPVTAGESIFLCFSLSIPNSWVRIFVHPCVCVHAQLLSRVRLCATLRTKAHQAPLSMGFPWQEYWSGLPFPSPGHLPNPGINPASLASSALATGFLITAHLGNPWDGTRIGPVWSGY